MITALLIGAAFVLAMGLDVLRTAHRIDALIKASGRPATGDKQGTKRLVG